MDREVKSLIVLIVDGIHAGLLGPYGNTWIETPGWNRLATQSWLAEAALLDHVDARENLRSIATGTHAYCRSTGGAQHDEPWWNQLDRSRWSTMLVTDDAEVAASDWARALDDVELVEQRDDDVAPEFEQQSGPNDTQMGRLFAAASAGLARIEQPFLMIAHARGLLGRWDAPQEWRRLFVDEDDPEPPTWIDPPVRRLAEDYDPDWLHGVRAAAGAQVMLLDQCIDALLDRLAETWGDRVRMGVTSSRGLGLGEHLWVGGSDENLHAEAIQVPMLLYDPALRPLSYRAGGVWQMPDFAATLQSAVGLDPCSDDVRGDSGLAPCALGCLGCDEAREDSSLPLAVTLGDDRWALRTAAWNAIARITGSDGRQKVDVRDLAERIELYVKPDDRWELNNVADRCPAVVEAFADVLCQLLSSAPRCMHHSEPVELPSELATT